MLAGLVADLGDKCGNAQQGDDLVADHRGIEHRHKNASGQAGVRENLQELLLGFRHGVVPTKKPAQGGPGVWLLGLQLNNLQRSFRFFARRPGFALLATVAFDGGGPAALGEDLLD